MSRHYFPNFITLEFFTALQRYYPETCDNLPLRNAVMYLAFGHYNKGYVYGEDSYLKQIPAWVLAELEGKSFDSKNYSAQPYLATIRSILPELTLSKSREGQVRMVMVSGFTEAFELEIADERKRWAAPETRYVHYETGRPQNAYYLAKLRKGHQEAANRMNEARATNPDQVALLDKLNGLSSNIFTSAVQKNWKAAYQLAESLKYKNAKGLGQELDKLQFIRENPQPAMMAVSGTCRLFTLGSSFMSVRREIRSQLLDGFLDFDIDAAHLAIIAKDWNVPTLSSALQECLDTGANIWSTLFGSSFDMTTDKATLKEATYSLVYGMSRVGISANILKATDVGYAAKFWEVPLMAEILEARRAQFAAIRSDLDNQRDCYGNKIAMERKPYQPSPHLTEAGNLAAAKEWDKEELDRVTRRALALKSQAVELKLIANIVNLTAYKTDQCIAVYSFDGFMVHVASPSKKAQIVKYITTNMNEHFTNLGYKTRLTVK